MADRRKQQNYQSLPHYFTEDQWNFFQHNSREKCCSVMLSHAFGLGLRCPAEPTFAVMYNMLDLLKPIENRDTTSFEKYEKVTQLKKDWKMIKHARRGEEFAYTNYLEILPEDPRDLDPEYWIPNFSEHLPVPCSALVLVLILFFFNLFLTSNKHGGET